MPRRYELKRRAEQQEETRRRIVEAAIQLHGSVGVTGTTITEIAERAGVGRQTVYRHFPDTTALVSACSGLYFDRHPLPDVERWRTVADPEERTRRALGETFAFHRETDGMLSQVFAETAASPVMEGYHAHWRRGAAIVASAWSGGDGPLVRAAVGHALAYPTWRSLVRDHDLTDAQAGELMLRAIHAAANADLQGGETGGEEAS